MKISAHGELVEPCELCVSVVKSDPEVSDFDIRISDLLDRW
jgi:hypothetical protein